MISIKPDDYLTPRQLQQSPERIDYVQLIGGCIFDMWPSTIGHSDGAPRIEHVAFDHAGPPTPTEACDFRIVQVPLRSIYGDWHTMPLGYDDPESYASVLDLARGTLTHFFDLAIAAAPDTPTFFLNYAVPQNNPFGRLLPRYDLRNPICFVETLNRLIEELAGRYSGVYILDADRIAATYGRRFVQDDPFWVISHGGLINDADWHRDQGRLESEAPLSERFDHDIRTYIGLLWQEVVAMLRTIRGTDRIKMVCVDLDDTLWPGIIAEAGVADHGTVEGWAIGVAEALAFLRKRGIILAIVSKNDEQFIHRIFPEIFGSRLPLEAFPIRKINWRLKGDNLREAIAEANLLPSSVLFIDDNPVEREHALQALPGLRVLGAPHLDWRRILLWSPELQLPSLTEESLLRNDMIAAQVAREQERATVSSEDFLTSLRVSLEIGTIGEDGHPRIVRALELLNKTNQFNTTGKRWSRQELAEHLSSGGRLIFATLADRFTQYGLIAIAVMSGARIEQFVMSCRVFGLGVEATMLAEIARRFHDVPLSATLVETERNGPCRALYRDMGWRREGDRWFAVDRPRAPAHVLISHVEELA